MRYMVRVCVGLLTAAVAACVVVPEAAAPLQAPSLHHTALCSFDANKVVDLVPTDPPFDAAKYGFCGVNGCDAVAPVAGQTSSYASVIANVINTYASPRLRADLCTLDKIYIDNNSASPNADAWGMRELQNGNVRHIGMRVAFLDRLRASTKPMLDYQNGILNMLIKPSSYPQPVQQWLAGLSYSQASPDDHNPNPPTTALLAVLAHEMGHILWVDKIQYMTSPCNASDPVVQNKYFYHYSWAGRGVRFIFHKFGDIDRSSRPKSGKSLVELLDDLNKNKLNQALSDLKKIYGGDWASLLATVSADEDFVETYELLALRDMNPPLSALEVTIPPTGSTPISIYNHLIDPNKDLYKKARWIDLCL